MEDDEEVTKSPSNGIELPQFMNESTGKIALQLQLYISKYTETGLPLR